VSEIEESQDIGLSEDVINQLTLIFRQNSKIEEVILYGSRAKGNFRNGSDVDLTMVGKEISLSEQFKIENEIDDLLLPYKFDISLFHQIENPDLIDHIKRVGIPIFKQ
tara:strand:+ start:271 stop:594 length:324 start_codon:yes stop_codon:yes gene_type:complete